MNTNTENKGWGTNFWLVALGKTVSQLGDGIFSIAMPWYILSVTNSAIAMSVYLVVQNLSCGLGLLIFSQRIDVWKKEKIMYTADYIRAVYLFILFVSSMIDIPNKMLFIYLAAIILNLCMSVFNPASMSIISLILDKEKLVKGNSILSIIDNTISIIGLTVGIAIYEFLGVKLVFLFSSFFYFISGISEMFIKPNYPDCSEKKIQKKYGGLIAGIKYLHSHKKILFIILFALIWNYIYISIQSVYLPYLFNITFDGSIGYIGTIQILEGIGLIIGAALASRVKMNRALEENITKIVQIQMPIFVGLTITLLINKFIVNSVYFVAVSFLILFFGLGLTVAIVNVNVNAIIQGETDIEYMGRVNSLKSLGSMISMALGLFIGGVLVDNIPIVIAFAINSALFILLTLFMTKYFGIRKSHL